MNLFRNFNVLGNTSVNFNKLYYNAFTEAISKKVGPIDQCGTMHLPTSISSSVNAALIDRGSNGLLCDWWDMFIQPYMYYVPIHYTSKIIDNYFTDDDFTLLSPTKNYRMYKKTNSIDNKPVQVTHDVALNMHKAMVREVVIAEFPELESEIPPVDTLGEYGHNYRDYTLAVCNKTKFGRGNGFRMVVPFIPTHALIGVLVDEPDKLVFVDPSMEVTFYHRALKPL